MQSPSFLCENNKKCMKSSSVQVADIFYFNFLIFQTTNKILLSWVCHMVAGKVEFSQAEDAHVIGDCIKVYL